MVKTKRAQIEFSLFDIIAGLLIISGGVFVVFSYTNLGLFVALVGSLLEAVKILIKQGALS